MMLQRFFALFTAICTMLLCGVRVSAQELVTVPAGGLRHISVDLLESYLGAFELAAVTLPPTAKQGILYLDGKPLPAYQLFTREQAARLMLFSSAKAGETISIGVSALSGIPPKKVYKISCINRRI